MRLLDGERAVQFRLRLTWWGRSQIVKLIVPPGFKASIRRDGTPGAIVERPMDAREYPITDIVSVAGAGASLTAVSPDIYGADVLPDGTMRITLLRCPVYAHHDPSKVEANGPYPVTDQGVHEYEIDLLMDRAFEADRGMAASVRLNFPLWISESTKGMPTGWRYDNPPKRIPIGLPPVMPLDAMTGGDLLDRVLDSSARVVAGKQLSGEWSGEQLLVSKKSSLKLSLPVAVDAKYRLSLAWLSGKGFGPMEVIVGGKLVASLPSGASRPRAKLDVLSDLYLQGGGESIIEMKAKGPSRVAVGFIHLEPMCVDIPATAWMVAGPVIFAEDTSPKALANVEDWLRQPEYAPEKSRDFDAQFQLPDGSAVRWRSIEKDSDYVDFHALTGKKSGSIHYAVTHVWSEAARTARLEFGLDYWGKIWVNGAVVKALAAGTAAPFKRELSLDVPLEKGWNELMLKVASGSGGNGFWMSISDFGNVKFSRRI